jgi:hypothetical protein
MLRDPLTPKHKLGVCCWGWALVEQNSTARLLHHAHLPRPAGPGFCQGRKRFPYQLPFAVWFCSAAGRLVPHSPDIRFHGGSTPEYSHLRSASQGDQQTHQRQPPPPYRGPTTHYGTGAPTSSGGRASGLRWRLQGGRFVFQARPGPVPANRNPWFGLKTAWII